LASFQLPGLDHQIGVISRIYPVHHVACLLPPVESIPRKKPTKSPRGITIATTPNLPTEMSPENIPRSQTRASLKRAATRAAVLSVVDRAMSHVDREGAALQGRGKSPVLPNLPLGVGCEALIWGGRFLCTHSTKVRSDDVCMPIGTDCRQQCLTMDASELAAKALARTP
jgi:hypothetical protein